MAGHSFCTELVNHAAILLLDRRQSLILWKGQRLSIDVLLISIVCILVVFVFLVLFDLVLLVLFVVIDRSGLSST